MSTNDVPGMNPNNQDTLHAGCWAEHADGTLIYVLGTEGNKVIYELMEFSTPGSVREAAPVAYRDVMKLLEFEKQFSFNPANPKSVKWTWHDKTLFPWHKVMADLKPGVRPTSAKKQIDDAAQVRKVRRKHAAKPKTMAQAIAKDRGLKPRVIESAEVLHQVEREMPKGRLATRIRDKIQSAIGKLKVGP